MKEEISVCHFSVGSRPFPQEFPTHITQEIGIGSGSTAVPSRKKFPELKPESAAARGKLQEKSWECREGTGISPVVTMEHPGLEHNPVELSLPCSWMSFSSPNLEFCEEFSSMECKDSAARYVTRARPSLAPSWYSQDLPTTQLLFQGSSIYLKKEKNVLKSSRVRWRGRAEYSLIFRG